MVVVHVLGDGHEYAFVALHAVAGLDLRAREDGDRDGENGGHDAERFFGEDSLDPFAEILVQEREEGDSCCELYEKQRKRKVEVELTDGLLLPYVGAEVDKEGDEERDD